MSHIDDLQCSDHGISLKWKDEQSYDAAKTNWDWVNQDDERYIAMVTNSAACGGHRQVYKVYKCETDSASLSMSMDAKPVDFIEAFPFMKFRLSTTGVPQDNAARGITLEKRATVTIPAGHDFSGTNIFTQNIADGLDVSLTCGSCMTTGNIDIDLEVNGDITKFPPIDGSITVTPSGISATVGLDLVVSAELTSEFDKSITFLNIPLIENPLSVAGIATVGPSLMVNMDAKIESVTAEVDLSLGSVTLSIPDDSKATLDFFDSSKDSTTDFTPQFTTTGPSVSAGISASANFGPNIVLGLDVEALGVGLAAGLALAAPTLDLTASFNENGCAGVDFEADLTAQLNAFGGAGKIADVAADNTISLIGTSTQIFSICLTVPTDAAATMTAAAAPVSTPFGGIVGATLSDIGCQAATNSMSAAAPALCAADGGDASFTQTCPGVANQCCNLDQACGMATDSDGVSGLCCT